MANPDHVAMLKRSVDEWNKWRYENPHIKPDLSHVNLSHADLSDAYVFNADLSNAELSRANLSRTDLSSANLSKADLSGANLSDAILIKADLSGANLNDVNLIKADLSDADLSDATLIYINLSGAYLHNTNLYNTNLSNVILRNAKLVNANLSNATLHNANLYYANLSNANLSYANLIYTDLSNADLINANLYYAKLSNANLSSAQLWKADLNHAKLENVVFTGAFCEDTIFTDVDLSQAIGLETVRHKGRSHIDIQTLYNSQGNIPDVFLRGCGIPEDFITYLPSLTNKPIQFYSCFISYNHKDKAFAQRVHDTLQGRGIRCWLDEKEINPGEKIMDAVAHGIRYWDKVILCASQHSLNSWWVDNEIDSIFAKERDIQAEKGTPIPLLIPCDIDGHLFSSDYQGGKKEQIKSRLAANFQGWERDNALFEEQIERVIKALRTDGGKQPPPKSQL